METPARPLVVIKRRLRSFRCETTGLPVYVTRFDETHIWAEVGARPPRKYTHAKFFQIVRDNPHPKPPKAVRRELLYNPARDHLTAHSSVWTVR